MKLHVGCGMNRRADMVNCDLHRTAATDVVFDAQRGWPFQDNSASDIFSCHLLEHLSEPMMFFQEAWRVLRPTGTLTLQLPYGSSDHAMSDLTHRRAWFPGSFCAFQPGYGEAVGNPQHEWPHPFAVNYVFMRVPKDLLWLLRRPWRSLGMRLLRYLWGGFVELFVQMTALKTPAQVETFHQYGKGNIVSTAVVAWLSDWDLSYSGSPELVQFASGRFENTAPTKETATWA